jgi:alkanesulfonate monooxygenase SsuD/methylene tetrahydromethanopterin reductase-like flavin-dependent oxidoreductase (luciferase family)
MKFGLLYEMDMPADLGATEHEIYWQAVEQVKLAEQVGFEYVWAVEHHFLEEFSHSSAPEIFLTAVSQHTSTMRIGHGVVLLPTPFNHPARVAERTATLDILCNGRLEVGTGRSITMAELGGFDIDPDDSRPMWDEAVRMIPQMWTEKMFPGHDGKYVKMPPRAVVPKPFQKPHPPMWMACTSPPSFELAGRYGLGVLCFTIGEPGELESLISSYRQAIANPEPVSQIVNEQVAGFTVLHCGPDDTEARRRGGEAAIWYFGKLFEYFGEIAAYDGYRDYRKRADDSKAFYREDLKDKLIDNLVDRAVICAGDPDRCYEIVKQYEAQGIDQFLSIVQVGTIKHDEAMECIRMFGEEVIPRFR